MSKINKGSKKIIEISESDTDSEIEYNGKDIKPQVKEKQKRNYVLTEARKNQFDKARSIRLENIKAKKAETDIKHKELNDLKSNLEKLKEEKQAKLKEKQINKLNRELKDFEKIEKLEKNTEIKIRKTKPRAKKTVIESESDSSSSESSDEEIEVKPKSRSKPRKIEYLEPVKYVRPQIQYF